MTFFFNLECPKFLVLCPDARRPLNTHTGKDPVSSMGMCLPAEPWGARGSAARTMCPGHDQLPPSSRNLQEQGAKEQAGWRLLRASLWSTNWATPLKVKRILRIQSKHSWNTKCEPSLAMSVNLHDEMYHNTITLQNPIFPLSTEWWDIHYFLVLVILCLGFFFFFFFSAANPTSAIQTNLLIISWIWPWP